MYLSIPVNTGYSKREELPSDSKAGRMRQSATRWPLKARWASRERAVRVSMGHYPMRYAVIRSTCCMPIAVSASVAQPSASRRRAKSTISRSSGAVMGGFGSG